MQDPWERNRFLAFLADFSKKVLLCAQDSQFYCLLAPSDNNENDLLRQVIEGHEQAFTQLFHYYHHQLGAYIYQLTFSRELAEEIVQDVFLKIWINRASLGEVKNFKAWLWIVSKNHALNALRKALRESLKQKAWEKMQPSELQLLPEESMPEEQFQLIDQAISQLPPQQKKVFIMSRYRRLKYEEIAQEMNISKETVKSYLQIAVSSIRKFVVNRLPVVLVMVACYCRW